MATSDDGQVTPLGPCCICETEVVMEHNGPDAPLPAIVYLRKKAPIAGRGWGCLRCGLPKDGAIAVLCGPCADEYYAGRAELRFACRGYPCDGRVPIGDLSGSHEHDLQYHPEAVAPTN